MILIAGAIVLCIYIAWKKYSSILHHIPGPKQLPFIGNAHQLEPSTTHKTLTKWAEEFSDVYTLNILGRNTVVLSSVDTVHEALVRKSAAFAGRPPSFVTDVLAYGSQDIVFQSYTPKMLRLRKVATSVMKSHGVGFVKLENLILEEVDDLLRSFADYERMPFDCRPLLNSTIFNITCSLILGERLDKTDGKAVIDFTQRFVEVLHPTESALINNFPWLRHFGLPVVKKMNDIVKLRDEFVDKHFNILKSSFSSSDAQSIFDGLFASQMEDNALDPYTDTDIKAIIMDFLLSATFTTSNSLYYTILLLVNFPDVQQAIYEEVIGVVGEDRLPKPEDRSRMPYCEAVVHEVLRYFTMNPVLLPHCTMEDTTVGGFQVPKDTDVLCNVWKVHHDPALYADPWTFRPSRFLDGDGNLVPPDHPSRRSFYAFGAGRRSCFGENLALTRLVLFVTSIIQKFQLLPEEQHSMPSCDPRKFSLNVSLIPPDFKIKAMLRT